MYSLVPIITSWGYPRLDTQGQVTTRNLCLINTQIAPHHERPHQGLVQNQTLHQHTMQLLSTPHHTPPHPHLQSLNALSSLSGCPPDPPFSPLFIQFVPTLPPAYYPSRRPGLIPSRRHTLCAEAFTKQAEDPNPLRDPPLPSHPQRWGEDTLLT